MTELTQQAVKPSHPYWVLCVAVVLPGMGQVLNNSPIRGLTMVFFMLVLGVVTFQLASPEVSIIGKFAGGLFIYALSVMDAYLWAKLRWETWKYPSH